MATSKHLSTIWARLCHRHVVRGQGVFLYTAENHRIMDFASGIGTTSLGHCHPRMTAVIKQQADELLFAQMNCVANPHTNELADVLHQVTPAAIDQFFITNTGSEAIEAMVKLVRSSTQRSNLIVFQGSFHGRTCQAMAMTASKTLYKARHQPPPPGIFVSPFPNAYYYGWSEDQAVDFALKELKSLLNRETRPSDTAAIVIEPVLGEGGYVPAPPRFLQGLRQICNEHGIMLVYDEVQCGFGRAGKMFAFEHFRDAEPDVLVMAKGMGSGMPVAAIGASSSAFATMETGSHGGTYGGGSMLSVRCATEVIRTIQEEGLCEHSAEMGSILHEELRRIQSRFPQHIGDVRGLGLMIGTEFSDENGQPAPAVCSAVQKKCLEQNLLLLTCSPNGNTIRWVPPLIVEPEHIKDAIQIFENALEDVDSVKTSASQSQTMSASA